MFGNLFRKKKAKKEEKKQPEKKPVKAEKKAEKVTLITNAKGWPSMAVPKSFLNENENFLILAFAAMLKGELDKLKGFKISHLAKRILTSKGILDVPIEVEHDGEKYYVFLYTKSDKEAAKQYNAAKKFVKSEYGIESYYYAPSKLDAKAAGGKPFRLLNEQKDFVGKPDAKLEGQYAMWWSSGRNDKFIGSECHKNIKRAFKAMAGIETYIFCAMGKALGFYKEKSFRLKLPEKNMDFVVDGPDDRLFIFSASEEKGMKFKFNTKETSAEYRDNFWKVFADYVENIRKVIFENNAALDNTCASLIWLEGIEAVLKDKKQKLDVLGLSV
jgi:hypothetical protein